MSGKTLTLPKKAKPPSDTARTAPSSGGRRRNVDGLPPTKARKSAPAAQPVEVKPSAPEIAPRKPRPKPAEGSAASGATRPFAKREESRKPVPRRDEAAASVGARPKHHAPERTAAAAPPAANIRTAPDDGKVRVSKLMSERGLCSRREADAYIERGWVFVDGVKVTELGTRIFANQTVTLSRDAQTAQLQSVTILLNKPIGFVSGQPEPGYKPAVTLIVPDNRWKDDEETQRFNPVHLRGLAPAGRLDIDSTGLIVFTQDGRIAKKLIGEDSNIEKEYLVRVEGQIIEGGLKKLNFGLSLDGKALKPAKVSWQNEDQLRFVLREGKKRQIRRMCELVGLKVVGLKRIRIGSVVLGKLPVGQWRYLREDERF